MSKVLLYQYPALVRPFQAVPSRSLLTWATLRHVAKLRANSPSSLSVLFVLFVLFVTGSPISLYTKAVVS